jgi:hypothetical protein
MRNWPFVLAGLLLVGAGLIANEWTLGALLTARGHINNPGTRLVLLVLDIAAIAAGVLLIVRGRRAPWRQMLLSVIATVLMLVVLEVGLRVFFGVRSWVAPPDRQVADTIGWRPAPDADAVDDIPGFGRVRYTTTPDGFRVFGDPRTTRTKVLVLGDSYTEARMISDGETYYERLAKARPDLEIFAIGGGGFGTLQEYLVLDEWVDRIKPDWILVQTHPNDLINNSHALESRSATNNNQMTRPYWEDGRAVLRFPENERWGALYNLARHSYLIRLLNINLHFLRSGAAGSVERELTSADPDVVRAVDTTVELFSMMKRRAGVPVVVFSTKQDRYFPFWSIADVCARAGVIYLPGVGEAVDDADQAGEAVTGRPFDSHWNSRGHELAARVLGEGITRISSLVSQPKTAR